MNFKKAQIQTPQLHYLNVKHSPQLTDDILDELIGGCPHLNTLYLEGCSGIQEKEIREEFPTVPSTVSKNKRYIYRFFSNDQTLTELRLEENDVAAVQALAEALKVNRTLDTLILRWGDLKKIRNRFHPTHKDWEQVMSVNSRRNTIGNEGASALGEALRVNTVLSWLDLSTNGIDDKGISSLVIGLRENETLTGLNLSSNNIGDEGAKVLIEALKVNNTLAVLNLFDNRICYIGWQDLLGEALLINTRLEILNLSVNCIQDRIVPTLVEALRVNTTLTELSLFDNKISDAGRAALKPFKDRVKF